MTASEGPGADGETALALALSPDPRQITVAPGATEPIVIGARVYPNLLPAWRMDLEQRPRHPLTLQWRDDPDSIRAFLENRGWRAAPRFDMTAPMRWLNPEASVDELPVLPQVHDGRHETLVMLRQETAARRMVLRLWPSRRRLIPAGEPLSVGTVTYQERDASLPLFTIARTMDDYTTPFEHFSDGIGDIETRRVPSGRGTPPPGRLLLR